MAVITSVKPQKNKKRVNIYLDDKFGFGIDLENFVKLGLKVEQELSDEKVKDIVRTAEFQKTLDHLLKFAMLRPRSEKEINDWFRRKKVHESMQKDLFDRLKHFELIDDAKFARWWVDQRIEFRKKGKRALAFELRNKGIDSETVANVLADTVVDEKAMAIELLTKKGSNWDEQKCLRYLAGRGFDWETAKSAVDDFLQKR